MIFIKGPTLQYYTTASYNAFWLLISHQEMYDCEYGK